MTTQIEILERVLKDLRYYQQYGAKVILETAIFDLEHVIKEPPASKPLTDGEIDLRTSHIYHRGRPVDRDYRICLFREAEAAHGIKEQP